MIKKPKGFEDIFPDKIGLWNHIKDTAEKNFKLYNFREMRIPIMEYTEVFARGLGNETDIVSKEMFTFEDRGGRSLTLRPEGTASVVRAYVENGDYNRLASCKLSYFGPMFRAENVQKGRLRQFHQFGAEMFGSDDPYHDYELIALMDNITKSVGVENYDLLINSIGCTECRPTFTEELKKYYQDKINSLCTDCQKRLDKNPLRLLDCKQKGCNELKTDAPKIANYLCENCNNHHTKLKGYLDNSGIKYKEDDLLVRGLDYYTTTTFEFVSSDLGSQSAFAAGGRYNGLVEQFDGKPTPGVGFAAGMERLFILLEDKIKKTNSLDVYMVHTGDKTLTKAMEILAKLRENNISGDLDPSSTGFKSQLKKANRENSKFVIIIGENELNSESATIKELETGEQNTIKFSEITDYLCQIIKKK